MARGRLLLLGLGVTALLAVAAVASGGRPLSRSKGTGPSPVFFDYVFTTIVIFAVAMVVIVLLALALQRPGPFKPPPRRWRILSTLLSVLVSAAAVLIFLHSGLGHRLQELNLHGTKTGNGSGTRRGKQTASARNAHVRWDEIAVVLVLVAGCIVLFAAGKGAKRTPRPWRLRSQGAVLLALDESLDDLRNEPDLRRAIIAAYARMEHALAVGGLPRKPSEAPFEYVERALVELDTSSASVRRLTDLFEWAKFSQHEPEPEMRDDAINALVAVRDELRQPVEAALA